MRRKLAYASTILPILLSSCGESPPAQPAASPKSAEAKADPRSYALTGVVRQVNRETGTVAIRHEAIPGFMPEMTMPFDLKGQEILEDLQPGDTVRGTLRVEKGEMTLTEVEITELATVASPEPPPRPPTLEPGQPVPDFAVTLQDGETLRLSYLRGKVVVLTFIYTRCPLPNFCPLMDKNFAELARWVKSVPARAEEVRLLSVSFDPEHDTPEALAAHAKLRGAKPPVWQFAVASHDELRRVAGPLGLMYAPTGNEIIHGLSTAVIDPEGRLARLVEGSDWTPDDLRRTIAGLASRQDDAEPAAAEGP